jgi:hypothetical protein
MRAREDEMPKIGLFVDEGGQWHRVFHIGDRVVPIAGPWTGSSGKVVRVDGQQRISVEFDNEPRAPRGVGFYDGRWLRKTV